jgi:hypothetical protein
LIISRKIKLYKVELSLSAIQGTRYSFKKEKRGRKKKKRKKVEKRKEEKDGVAERGWGERREERSRCLITPNKSRKRRARTRNEDANISEPSELIATGKISLCPSAPWQHC